MYKVDKIGIRNTVSGKSSRSLLYRKSQDEESIVVPLLHALCLDSGSTRLNAPTEDRRAKPTHSAPEHGELQIRKTDSPLSAVVTMTDERSTIDLPSCSNA
jgi:hypothetical protein